MQRLGRGRRRAQDGGLRLMWVKMPLGRKERHPRNSRVPKNKTAPEMLAGLWIWSFPIFPNYEMFQSQQK